MYTGDWLPRDGFGSRFSIHRAHCIAKGCMDGGRLAAASSTRAVPKVVPHIASIWLLSCGVYGGEKRSWIWRSARNSRKWFEMNADPLSQLTTCGLMVTDDCILAEMSAMKSANVVLATSFVIVCAATTRP